MDRKVDHNAESIWIRDIIEEIEEITDLVETCENEGETVDSFTESRLTELQGVLAEIKQNVDDMDSYLIAERAFEAHCKSDFFDVLTVPVEELPESVQHILRKHVDWQSVAAEDRGQYAELTVFGVPFLVECR